MYKLFVLSGASGVGKSTMLFKLVDTGLCEVAPKYSEREERKGKDDIIHVDNIYDNNISCDITYKMYNTMYGINTREIKDKSKEHHQIIIISDIESLKKIQVVFDNNVITVYILLSDICIESLIEACIYREELIIPEKEKKDLILLAKKISEIFKSWDDKEFHKFDEEFHIKVEKYFSNDDDFKKFIKRYESWTKAREIYESNMTLFDYSFAENEDYFNQLQILIKSYNNK